jgi:four helix bundle protein
MQRFTDLRVWQRSHALVLQVYRLTKALPTDERYGLVSQLRRAVLSVPTNIAEGTKREWSQDYARFLNIAEGSLVETEYLLMVTRDLGYASGGDISDVLKEIREIASMLHGLRLKVEQWTARKLSA